MQSGYGVPEIQQLLVDQQQQQQQQQRFHPFHPFPLPQHFFQQNYQFQAFQQQQQRRLHQQLGLEHDPGPPTSSNSPSGVVVGGGPFIAANFKLSPIDNSSSHEPLLGSRGGGEDGSESRAAASTILPWQHREEDSAIKEPFWKPFDIEFINRTNKRCKEKIESPRKLSKKCNEGNDNEEGKSSSNNFGLFGELEAIYAHGSSGGGSGVNTQAGSGSALTGDNNPPASTEPQGPTGGPRSSGIDHGSETSTGEEASLKKLQKIQKKKKRKQMSTIAVFFETLVKQLMDHQECLHQKFLEVMERRDQERMDREEDWRQQEAAKWNREAIARAQEQALAASREAAIVAFLEKITGKSIDLPTTAKNQLHEPSQREENHIELSSVMNNNNNENENMDSIIIHNANNINTMYNKRWPKPEVQALIRVRSNLESKFQEPGLKGPLWEEVSSSMAALGYQRSAKRCKEKWENINKYFRKTKDCAKKRSQQSKTCPYFQQLDQLYSKPLKPCDTPTTALERKDNSELLDAMLVPTDPCSGQIPNLEYVQGQRGMRTSFKFNQMGSMTLDFGGDENDNCNNGAMVGQAGKELFGFELEGNDVDEEDDGGEDDEDEDEEGEEGEGENQDHLHEEHPQQPVFFSP